MWSLSNCLRNDVLHRVYQMKIGLISVILLLILQSTYAGRPLITDDAGVIGANKVQLETWLYSDKRSFQNWVIPTLGIGDSLELSAAGVHGIVLVPEQKNTYSMSGPILQTKVLLKETKLDRVPGLAVSGGAIAPYGKGFFKSPTWEYFYYLAASSYVTKTDKLLIHANIGRQTRLQFDSRSQVLLWGIAAEIKTGEKTFCFMEASNGEVYAINQGIASHAGIRHDLTPYLQIDGSIGNGITGNPRLPLWVTLGIKLVN